MKVALVSEYYYPDVGGMPECVHHLAHGLAALGHEPTILTSDFGSEEHDMPPAPRVKRLGKSVVFFSNGSISRATVGWRIGAKVRQFLHEERFDVLHLHGPQWPLLPQLALHGAPPETAIVGTLHTFFDDNVIMRALRQPLVDLFEAIDATTSVSENAARAMMRYVPDLRYRVIANGIDIPWLRGGKRLPELDDGRVNFMFLGRLEPRNELPRLIEAFSLARAARDNIRLVVVGDGPERRELEQLVPDHAKDSIVFVGSVLGGRPSYFASSDVYCFTTRIGAMPISLLEALGAGKAIIAPAIEPVRELCTSGKEGLIVPLDSLKGFVDAIISLADDRVAREEMSAAALRTAQKFAWPRIVDRYLDVYHEARETHAARGLV